MELCGNYYFLVAEVPIFVRFTHARECCSLALERALPADVVLVIADLCKA